MPIPAIAQGDEPTLVGGEMTTWGVWKDSSTVTLLNGWWPTMPAGKCGRGGESNKLPAGLSDVKIDAGYLTTYYDQYAQLRVFPYFDRVYLPNGMWDVLCKNGQDVLAGGITPEQATENIAKEYARLRASQ
jgi:raffinose/stachyose/melibiose transport system substrate-binding protein